MRQGIVDRNPATTLDLTATYLDYAGVRIPDDMDSRSMRMLLEGRKDGHRDIVYTGLKGWRAVLDGRYKFVEGYDPSRGRLKQAAGATLLFDLREDPTESLNIAGKAAAEVKRLREMLSYLRD